MPEWLTEPVIVQIVLTLGVVLGAGIPAFFTFRSKLAEIGADAREAREQVKNSHTTNLREEGDERHTELKSAMTEIARDVRGLREDHRVTRGDIGVLHGAVRGVRREISGLTEADEQGREQLSDAVKERHQELNRLRAVIPDIIRREIKKTFTEPPEQGGIFMP